MPTGIKNVLQRFQPAQLYIVLVLSICYFSVQMVFSHITHALTLLMASHQMLCNILALAGCIVTIKYSKRSSELGDSNCRASESSLQAKSNEKNVTVISFTDEKHERRAKKLRNTFGWTRIDILTMLIVCIILASLSFSLLVEALQTLIHIDHQHAMHLPIPVLILGLVGLMLNGLTYLLIGGYTMHQGSFLHVTPSGNVVLDRAMSNSGDLTLTADERQLSKTRNDQQLKQQLEIEIGSVHLVNKRQGAMEMIRDISSTVFVIACALIVYFAQNEEQTSKFIDPILSICSCIVLSILSYPYMKESCLILLQTIPGFIDIDIFERTFTTSFPQIVSYHDLHIWQLSANKFIATVHIKFQSAKIYTQTIEDVRNYFHEQGIGEVTIQPEFHCPSAMPSTDCLVQCKRTECAEKVCCMNSRSELRELITSNGSASSNNHSHSHKKTHKQKELKISQLVFRRNFLTCSKSTNHLESENKQLEQSIYDSNYKLKKTNSDSQILAANAENINEPNTLQCSSRQMTQ